MAITFNRAMPSRYSLCTLIFFVLTIFSTPSFAQSGSAGTGTGVEVGIGTNAYTGGRIVPSLEMAYLFSGQAVSWAATGVQSQYYYQSSHLLFYFRTWPAGTMWGGDMVAGFGGGIGYSVRGFQDENSTTETTTSDILGGPAIRMNWSYGPVYLNFSTVFGLRDWQKHLLGLNFQNVESLTLGVRF